MSDFVIEPEPIIDTAALLAKKYPRIIAWLKGNPLEPTTIQLANYLLDLYGGLDPKDTPPSTNWTARVALELASRS